MIRPHNNLLILNNLKVSVVYTLYESPDNKHKNKDIFKVREMCNA